MSLTLFKPNKANRGALFSIRFAAKLNKKDEDFKEGGFFINVIKQVSWDDSRHIGKFGGGENITIKIGKEEAAKIIHVIERNANLGDISGHKQEDLTKIFGFSNMHKSGNKTTYINFSPWQRKGDTEQSGFVFYFTQAVEDGKTTIGATFPYGDDILLREYLKLGLEHINMASYQEDKKRFESNRNGNEEKENNEAENNSEESPKATTTRRSNRPVRATARRAQPARNDSEDVEDSVDESSAEEEPLF